MIQALALPLLLSLSLSGFAEAALTPFKDSRCSQPQKMISKGKEISELAVSTAITNWDSAGGKEYNDMEFPEANTTGTVVGQGSNIVYWKVPKPDRNCVIGLMQYKRKGWQSATDLPGDVFLLAKTEGCYFSALTHLDDIITTYCCGSGDCNRLDLGTHQFNQWGRKRTIDAPEERQTIDAPAVPAKRNPSSRAAYASSIVKFSKRADAPKCEIVGEKTETYKTAGPQRAVSNPQTCNGNSACQFTITVNTFFATAVTTGESKTFTVEGGAEVSMTAGTVFFVEATATASFHASLAQAWEKNEGKTVTNQEMKGISQMITQQQGTTAFLSFTPNYECEVYNAKCGKDNKGKDIMIDNWKVCNPIKSGDLVTGDYTMVYM